MNKTFSFLLFISYLTLRNKKKRLFITTICDILNLENREINILF